MAIRDEIKSSDEYNGLVEILILSLGGLCSLVIVSWPAARALVPGFSSEFVNHSHLLKDLQAQGIPPYSLWYVLQKVIIRSDLRDTVLIASGFILIGGFALLRGVILTGLLRSARFNPAASLIFTVALCTAIALPIPFVDRSSIRFGDNTNYIGTIPANTFMSATQLVGNTGVLLAFFGLQLWAITPQPLTYRLMLLTSLLAILAKPGIAPGLLVAIVSTIALSCWRSRSFRSRDWWQAVIAIVLLLIPVLITSHFFLDGKSWLNIKTVFAPLDTWRGYSNQIFIDLVASFAFPLVVAVCLGLRFLHCPPWRSQGKSILWGLLPCWIATATSLAIFSLLAETIEGKIYFSGNFIWGAISANGGLHLASLIAMQKLPFGCYWLIAGAILALEAIGGFSYILNYALTGSYL